MNDRFNGTSALQGWASDSFTEAMWETLIVLVTTAAICLGTVSLATHLKETRTVRDTAKSHMLLRDNSDTGLPASLARVHGREEPRLN